MCIRCSCGNVCGVKDRYRQERHARHIQTWVIGGSRNGDIFSSIWVQNFLLHAQNTQHPQTTFNFQTLLQQKCDIRIIELLIYFFVALDSLKLLPKAFWLKILFGLITFTCAMWSSKLFWYAWKTTCFAFLENYLVVDTTITFCNGFENSSVRLE